MIVVAARCVKCHEEFSHEQGTDVASDAELSRKGRVRAREHRVKCKAMIVPVHEVRPSPAPVAPAPSPHEEPAAAADA